MKKPCPTPGCPTLIGRDKRRCDQCAVTYEASRGTKAQRGYDSGYESYRRSPAYLAATQCTACGVTFTAGNPRTAGHVKALREGGSSADGFTPQCARCNLGWRKTGL